MSKGELTAKQQAFVDEYLVDLNATRAATAAGYAAKSATVEGARQLANAKVAAAVSAAMKARSERTEITADKVLERWWAIANADVNDVVQFRRTACRHCHGKDHAYQWIDEREFNLAMSAYFSTLAEGKAVGGDAAALMAAAPKDDGGYGFSPKLDPVEDCPHCFGEGAGEVHALDTRKLKGPAKHLFAGIEVTQSGFKVKLHDKMRALENIARHLGMYNDKVEHTVVDRASMLAAARERAGGK